MKQLEQEVPATGKPEEGQTALAEVPRNNQVAKTMDDMFQEDAGAGLNNLGAGDFAIPFLAILQKNSPQVSRANAKYIKEAQTGMIMNTVTNDIYDGEVGILYVPCGFQKQLVRWKSRDSGGGLVCHYKEGDPELKTFTRDERGRLVDPSTKDVVMDTAYHFGLLLHDGGFPEFTVIGMSSTQLKASRTWNTIMKKIMKKGPSGAIYNPPSFSHTYRLSTVGQSRDSYDWMGWKIVIEDEIKDVELYKMAREFSKQVEDGRVRVSAPPRDFVEDVGDKEEVPF